MKHGNHDDDSTHAGTWKLAYADFITTMMAFFLLMWLLAISSEEQKKGISNYFQGLASYSEEQPLFVEDNLENDLRGGQGDPALAGGPMSLVTESLTPPPANTPHLVRQLPVTTEASSTPPTPNTSANTTEETSSAAPAMPPLPWTLGVADPQKTSPSNTSLPSLVMATPTPTSRTPHAASTASLEDQSKNLSPMPHTVETASIAKDSPKASSNAATTSSKHAEITKRLQKENTRFRLVEEKIEDAVQQDESLKKFQKNIIFQHVKEGLRVQIVDQKDRPLFSNGSSSMHKHTRKLLQHVAEVIKRLPNQIIIAGHTDAMPFAPNSPYSNWELSADRANASRKALEDAGLPSYRVDGVIGKEGTEPLIPDEPFSPKNRRISITLLRENFKEDEPIGLDQLEKATHE